jgi:hypothetical protein
MLTPLPARCNAPLLGRGCGEKGVKSMGGRERNVTRNSTFRVREASGHHCMVVGLCLSVKEQVPGI